MESQIVNENYLSHLIALSREQEDDNLVSQLFENLQNEYHLFRQECAIYLKDPSQRREFQNRLHKLKNNFYNLGCEEAGAVLEEMYQILKADDPDMDKLALGWNRLGETADRAFLHLQKSIAAHH